VPRCAAAGLRQVQCLVGRLPPRSPVFTKKGPPLVISPLTAEFEIARGQSLASESQPPDERERRMVHRLDIRLKAMETKLAKGARDDELKPLRHEAPAGVRLERVVPKIPALEGASDDLVDVDDTDERALLVVNDEVSFVRRMPEPPEPSLVRLSILRWMCKVLVKPPASADRGEKVGLPTDGWSFQIDTPEQPEAPLVAAQWLGNELPAAAYPQVSTAGRRRVNCSTRRSAGQSPRTPPAAPVSSIAWLDSALRRP